MDGTGRTLIFIKFSFPLHHLIAKLESHMRRPNQVVFCSRTHEASVKFCYNSDMNFLKRRSLDWNGDKECDKTLMMMQFG